MADTTRTITMTFADGKAELEGPADLAPHARELVESCLRGPLESASEHDRAEWDKAALSGLLSRRVFTLHLNVATDSAGDSTVTAMSDDGRPIVVALLQALWVFSEGKQGPWRPTGSR